MNEAYAEYLKTNDKAVLAKYKQLKAEYNSKYANTKPAAADGTPAKDSRRELLDQKNDVEIDIEASNSKIKTIQNKEIVALRANVSSTSTRGANVETMIEEVKLAEKEYLDANKSITWPMK